MAAVSLFWNTNMAAVSLFWNTNMAALTSCENALYSCHPRCLSWSNLWNIFLEKLIVKGANYAANLSRGAFSQSPGKVILNFTFESRAVCIPKSSHWNHFYGLCLYECPSCFQNLYGRSWSRWKREDLKSAGCRNLFVSVLSKINLNPALFYCFIKN